MKKNSLTHRRFALPGFFKPCLVLIFGIIAGSNLVSAQTTQTARRITRILRRALICAGGLAVIATAANAQTSLLAYRHDDVYGPFDCEAGCYWEVYPVVIPAGVVGYQPSWSPDGASLAFTDGYDIFVVPATGGNAVKLTNATTSYFLGPAWSPDGGQIAFKRWTPWTSQASEIDLMNRDGSGVRTLSNRAAHDFIELDHPTWSPDGARIAFTCEIDLNNLDICVINRDGTGLVRLTNDPTADSSPVWSPDGTRIAFSTGRFNGLVAVLALMNDDGSGVSQIGTSIQGWPGSWSPDGAQIAFTTLGEPQMCAGADRCYYPDVIYTTTPDGAVVTRVVDFAGDPAWMPQPGNGPRASFSFTCNGHTCSFDGSSSVDAGGTIVSYSWNFGDGIVVAGPSPTVSHMYAPGNDYSVTLTVIDDRGATATQSQAINMNSPPSASFSFACNLLNCSFDGSHSLDDGTIVGYAWNFGDGTAGSGPTISHTYAAGGYRTVTLTITDNAGATGVQSQTVFANSPPVASFTSSCNRMTCNFDGSASHDSDDRIVVWSWNFGDGSSGSNPATTHSYLKQGTYVVTLIVTDAHGANGTQSSTVQVSRRP
jgi:PKD repeat protein